MNYLLLFLFFVFYSSAVVFTLRRLNLHFDEIILLDIKFCPPECSGNYLEVARIAMENNISIPEKKTYPKRIEAVCVSTGYADFLKQTLPFNKIHFDRFIVVTAPADTETQAVCEYWHVECVVTDEFYADGATFNKAKGINEGLKRLSKSDWVLHLDADIFLMPRTREILNLLPLDAKGIYSIDRLLCTSFADWLLYLQKPERVHGNNGMMGSNAFPRGARLLNLDRDGYVPIGYFQLWNAKASGIEIYPDCHGEADRTDTLFAYQWERQNRHLIPELLGIHLESEAGPMGQNWKGRASCRFELER